MGYGIRSDNRVAERPLGIVTGNYVTPPSVELHQGDLLDTSTGEILTRTPQIARAERWALKSVVNRLLSGERVSKCMVLRAPIPGQSLAPIEVHKGHTHGKAFYHGLMSCGSVWTCPICAAKIAERRRVEETPPRAWGRRTPSSVGSDRHRNTPTGVGKTGQQSDTPDNHGKHPHGRGEDRESLLLTHMIRETPPRAWGRQLIAQGKDPRPGNTPTGVGKTVPHPPHRAT